MTGKALFLLLVWFSLEAGATGGLPKPCRSWSSCNQLRCTPEKPYQRSLTRHTPCSSGSTTPSPSSGECAVVNGTCTFTEDAPNCTSWLSPCERQYRCTTVEEYMSEASTMPNCSLSTQVPSPDSLCVAINGSCQWYNPCRTWRGHCWSGYQCGSESDYWAFEFGPQPICALPPFGLQTPPPAGECIIQNGQCSWSTCRSWLDWCQTHWLCGTNYEHQQYLAGYPPPCPRLPGNYTSPPEPGLCQFNTSSQSCGFNTSHVCPSGRQYKSCGSVCPITCANYHDPPSCSRRCLPGCFCPDDMVELEGECVLPSQCPSVNTTCPAGKEYTDCGSACPPTCDNYNRPVACTQQCVSGCFCPQGTVEHQGRCVNPSQCPSMTGVNTTCPAGKEYTDCGSACPPTCENYNRPVACTLQCVSGCFCPKGTVEHEGRCVNPSQCPSTTDLCAMVRCATGYVCKSSTNHAGCEPSCDPPHGAFHCGEDTCVLVNDTTCDPNTQPCPLQVQCLNTQLVPRACSPDTRQSCPSNSRCLTFNTTRGSFCLPSCFLGNGGCREDQVCTNAINEGCIPTSQLGQPQCSSSVQCTDISNVQGNCPPGFEYTTCGSPCDNFSCDDYPVPRNIACAAVCIEGCFCPRGLLRFRDRCVVAQECPSLLEDPPAANPLPLAANTVMVQLNISGVTQDSFNRSLQQALAASVQQLLQQRGYPAVVVTVHAVFTAHKQLQVVIQVSGDAITSESGSNLASLIAENSNTLNVDITEVSVVDAPRQHGGLTDGAIAGITITVLLVGITTVVFTAFMVYLIITKRRMTKPAISPDDGESKNKVDLDVGETYSKLKELENEDIET